MISYDQLHKVLCKQLLHHRCVCVCSVSGSMSPPTLFTSCGTEEAGDRYKLKSSFFFFCSLLFDEFCMKRCLFIFSSFLLPRRSLLFLMLFAQRQFEAVARSNETQSQPAHRLQRLPQHRDGSPLPQGRYK